MSTFLDQDRGKEAYEKLVWVRNRLLSLGASALRLRGVDWFAWATAGASNAVLITAEAGPAEVLITQSEAVVLTDEIEAERLRNEEVPSGFTWHVVPWAELRQRENFVLDMAAGGVVLSDRPDKGEVLLPGEFHERRLRLSGSEQARYRAVGQRTAEAMSEVMRAARPTWTEWELAGAGAEALWARGLHPALTLAAGERRGGRYRHPTPSAEPLGREAMLVFCARGSVLYANVTRFVQFTSPSTEQRRRHEIVRAVEAAGLQVCRPDLPLRDVYDALAGAYHAHGYPAAIREHHQGGITGYLAREVIATPQTGVQLDTGMALALNPSLPGVKIEDTFLLQADGLENLTLDSNWPTVVNEGRVRPLPLEVQ
jgi:Xaa-Pro aminopeptidase